MTASGAGARQIRVVAIQPGIAGGYACRLLADAGAQVSVLVPADGLRLQEWSTTGDPGAAGLLYRHLFAGATELPAGDADVVALLSGADVVVVDRVRADEALPDGVAAALESVDGPVIVEISPFGAHQPADPRPANEFSLQAACGSTGGRGIPGERPIAAGGRLGEWVSGLFAAVAALAGLETRRVRGGRVVTAVSLFESMASVYNSFEWLRTDLCDPQRDFGLWLDVPAAERAEDGWVGLTCITPAQWRAFVEMTDADAFRGDRALELLLGRSTLRGRLEEASGPWLRSHTVEAVLAEATRRQIPCSPIGNGKTLLEFDHFRERGLYRDAPDGAFRRPASPVILDGARLDDHRSAPLSQWRGIDRPADDVASSDGAAGLPLTGVRVLDLGAFWAGPGCTQILAGLGARVVKVEGVARPDGMRLVAARGRDVPDWWEYSGIYQGTNAGKEAVSIDLGQEQGRDLLLRLAADADVVVENFGPGVMERFGLTYERLREWNPRIVMVQMPAFGLSGPWRDRRGYGPTMDQVSGISWVTGNADGPPVGAKAFADFNGSGHAAFATLLALARRAVTGEGAHVEVALGEACLAVTADQVIEYSGSGTLAVRDGCRRCDCAPQGIYAAGDGKWLAVSVLDDDAWAAFVAALEPDLPTDPAGFVRHDQRAGAADELDKVLEATVGRYESAEAVTRLRACGVAAEVVVSPSYTDEDPDLVAGGFVRPLPHPIHGDLPYVTLPFTLDGQRVGPTTAAPTYGQHNHLLTDLFGVEPAEIEQLRSLGVVSDTPQFGQ